MINSSTDDPYCIDGDHGGSAATAVRDHISTMAEQNIASKTLVKIGLGSNYRLQLGRHYLEMSFGNAC